MRLIDRHNARVGGPKLRAYLVVRQLLRGKEKELQLTPDRHLQGLPAVAPRHGAAHGPGDRVLVFTAVEALDLVALQRYQRAYHQGRSFQVKRRQLVDRRFAAARWQHH